MRQILRGRLSQRLLLAGGLVLLLALLACKREPKTVKVMTTENEGPLLASVVRTSDASQAPQLLNGFYGIENNSWRWTAKQFSVLLRPPMGAAQSGARLDLAFTIPQAALDRAKSLTLSASVEGVGLPSETYTRAGQCVYKRDVPASAITKDALRIQFSLDKSIPPAGADRRELGVIVASVALEPI